MRNLLKLMVFSILATSGAGCALLPDGAGVEEKHDSALLAGQPFEGPKNDQKRRREDTLDVANVYFFWERGNFYTEAGVGWMWRDDGFHVDRDRLPIIFNGRTGVRFRFTKR